LTPRIEKGFTPSQRMKEIFNQKGSINSVLEEYSWLYTLDGKKI
jgi:hypothetical protein